ncbi:hypothetical protein RB195_009107 [Necator americanus]|uniref:SKP1 component dimerisation domain-containing protein n=1 Tax=Necator americanus TaxID=51031 RepID=A0ABR1CRT3_NECAM
MDARVISRGFRHSNLLSVTNESCGPIMNRDPIQIPFPVHEFEKFLFAIAMMKHERDLGVFDPSDLCTILKLADYFESLNLMQRVFSQINAHLKGKTPSEICEAFNIRSDFNHSQTNQMKREGLWHFNTSS